MPCVKKMPTRQGDLPGSGCRVDCLHRSLVSEYRAVKAASDEARKVERELETHGFATEDAEWDAAHPAWAFRDFLVSRVDPDRLSV